jgi:hypothetical protein
MNRRMRAAVQRLEELRGVPTMQACHAAAVLAGVRVADADECDDGAHGCPHCPWKETASNWRPRATQTTGP